MRREMNKNKATANLPPYDNDSRTDESSDNEKHDKAEFTCGTAIDPKQSQSKEENCKLKVTYDLTGDDEDAETTISELTNLTMATLGGEEESMMPTKLTFSNEGKDDNNSVLTTISATTNTLPVKTKDAEKEGTNSRVQGCSYHKHGICIAPPNLQLLSAKVTDVINSSTISVRPPMSTSGASM
eukprot:15349904-Ditylum_brightwellii.AAC.1